METLQRNEIEQLLDNFEVEELEDRMEFTTWGASASCTCGPNGCTVTVGVTCTL
ncbi:MAG: hypothetical protein M1470_07225 [Bacteroidetes bacterium]|nr:hypothetical protein [Bacteroidota bacterium]